MGKEGKGRGGKGKYLPDQCQTASGAPGLLRIFGIIETTLREKCYGTAELRP